MSMPERYESSIEEAEDLNLAWNADQIWHVLHNHGIDILNEDVATHLANCGLKVWSPGQWFKDQYQPCLWLAADVLRWLGY